MGELRGIWQRTKKWSDDAAAGKIHEDVTPHNPEVTRKLLKGFTDGFGPALDKVEAAYKKKDDANTKKYADAALKIAQGYETKILNSVNNGGAYANLAVMIGSLSEKLTQLKTHGINAKVNI